MLITLVDLHTHPRRQPRWRHPVLVLAAHGGGLANILTDQLPRVALA
jgi:hypothetical protein